MLPPELVGRARRGAAPHIAEIDFGHVVTVETERTERRQRRHPLRIGNPQLRLQHALLNVEKPQIAVVAHVGGVGFRPVTNLLRIGTQVAHQLDGHLFGQAEEHAHVKACHLHRTFRLNDVRQDGAQVGLGRDVVVLRTELRLVHPPRIVHRLAHDLLALAQHAQRLLQKEDVVVGFPHLVDHIHPRGAGRFDGLGDLGVVEFHGGVDRRHEEGYVQVGPDGDRIVGTERKSALGHLLLDNGVAVLARRRKRRQQIAHGLLAHILLALDGHVGDPDRRVLAQGNLDRLVERKRHGLRPHRLLRGERGGGEQRTNG